MNSGNIRNIELSISVDNLKSLVETWLRTTKVLHNSDEILSMEWGKEQKGLDQYLKATDLVPIKLKVSGEEVEVTIHK